MEKQEISFRIKKALGMRKGWKIIADDGEMIDGAALKTVVSIINDMECQVSKNISGCIISFINLTLTIHPIIYTKSHFPYTFNDF